MSESVVFKGMRDGLVIIMDEQENFDSILEQIKKKVEGAGRFFEGANIKVRYRGRKLSEEEKERIIAIMNDKSGGQVIDMEEDTTDASIAESIELRRKVQIKNYEEGYTKFYKGTVRSGQLLDYNGHITVIGDVNPGGEVIATGNIIVIGTVRGMIHAGAGGNKDAIVFGLNLKPTQLRIADLITRPPDNESEGLPIPEMAYIKDGKIYIEGYLHLKERT